MHGLDSPAALLSEQLGRVYRTAEWLARRNGFGADEAEAFRSSLLDHLTADDYLVIRRFRGESSLGTYLTMVAASHLRDFRAARWGRWRPSAEARRIGPPAPRLEWLVYRQELTLLEAGEVLRSRGETEMTDRQLAALFARLPRRKRLRPVEVHTDREPATPDGLASGDAASDLEARQERDRVYRALGLALSELPAEDRTLLRLHYWEGATVPVIARLLGRRAKPLYKRLDRLKLLLRKRLKAVGVEPADALDLIDGT